MAGQRDLSECVLLGFIAAKADVARAVAAFFASLVGVVTGIVGVFEPPGFPTIDPKVTRGVVAVILAGEITYRAGVPGHRHQTRRRQLRPEHQVVGDT